MIGVHSNETIYFTFSIASFLDILREKEKLKYRITFLKLNSSYKISLILIVFSKLELGEKCCIALFVSPAGSTIVWKDSEGKVNMVLSLKMPIENRILRGYPIFDKHVRLT